jgi:methyl-accepting chemotaxis protein
MKKLSAKSKDLPATHGMLDHVRSELKADIRGLRSEMKSGFRQMDSRFEQVDSRFEQVDSRFEQIDARFEQMNSRFSQVDSRFEQIDSKLEQVLSQVSRVGTLVEEQNSRNQVVLEGLTGLYRRQDRIELEAGEIRNTVYGLAARSNK